MRADQIFRALLRLFPSEFRGDFGDDMAADFRDERRDAARAGASMRLWFRTVADVLRRAPLEHADVLWRDVTYAVRTLLARPGFTVMAVVIFGLGIGANTSIFSLLNALLLRPLPVADPDRLVVLHRGGSAYFSYPEFRGYQSATQSLTGLAATGPWESDLSVDGRSEFITKEAVSANYAAVVGVRPAVGRWFDTDDELAAVISYHVWQNWFSGDPNVIGRRVQTISQVYTVVGVAPADFLGAMAPLRTDLWVPFATWDPSAIDDHRRALVFLFGRLSRDANPLTAAAELNAVDTELRIERPRGAPRTSPLAAEIVRGTAPPGIRDLSRVSVALLTIVVGLVLAIACVNVGNLLLVRGAARQRELAVRSALGASRGRLFRQLLTETLVLAVAGGFCGLLFARWTNDALTLLVPSIPAASTLQLNLTIDRRVLTFTAIASLASMLVCGLLPAWRVSRTAALPALKGEMVSRGQLRGRTAALVGQVTVSLILLLVAATVLGGLRQLQRGDPGFAIENRTYAWTFIPDTATSPEVGRQFYARALERLRGLPGVRSAAVTSVLPLSTVGTECVALPGIERIQATTNVADPGFLSTLRIAITAGRDFSASDLPSSPRVAIVSEALGRRLWPDRDPVGQQLLVGCSEQTRMEVIGVAHDTKIRSLLDPPPPHFYQAFAQHYSPLSTIVVESDVPSASMIEPITRTLRSLGEGVRVYMVQPVSDHIERSYWHIRWAAGVLAIFSALALGLAALGLYGVMAYRITLRTREIGIRLALGARQGDVLRGVLGQGLVLVSIGVIAGSVVAIALSRVLARFQDALAVAGPSTYFITGVIWLAVALLACYLPARRAARVDPIAAVRTE